MELKKRNSRPRKKFGKKGLITGVIVDFLWAPLLLLLVTIIFAALFNWAQEAKFRALEDHKDVVYGNYLAQVYLRKPVSVAGTDMTMTELIAMYDYNQSLEKAKDKSYANFIHDPVRFVMGKKNPMRDAIIELTEAFVEQNFDSGECFAFGIHSDSVDISYKSGACPAGRTFSLFYMFSVLRTIPNETFSTYIAPIDPRESPIVVYSVYDIERLLKLYSKDPYFKLEDWEKWALGTACVVSPMMAVGLPACSQRHAAAIGEAVR
jgi:hypothetical protein